MWGYADLLEAPADPNHPDHEDMKERVGPYFDPVDFDLDFINEELALT